MRGGRWAGVGLLFWGLLVGVTAQTASARELRVGVYDNEPKIYRDANGTPAGILIDLLQAIAVPQGWTLQPVTCEWQACLDALERGDIDLMPDVAWTEARARRFDFHEVPVMSSWSQVYALADARFESVLDLRGKRVAVLAGSSQESYLRELMAGLDAPVELLPIRSLDEGFDAVRDRLADAVVANQRYGDLHAAEARLVATPMVFQPARLFYAATRGRQTEVLAEIDRQLAIWKADPGSPYFEILQRWTREQPSAAIPARFWWVLAGILGALLLALVGAWTLRRQVARMTRDLHASRDQLNTILDSVGAYVYIKDTRLRYLYANRPVLDLFGRELKDVVGHGDEDFFDRETTARIHANDERVMRSGERVVEEEVNRVHEGAAAQTFLSVKLPLRRSSGEIYALCGISTDLTEHRRFQAEIHQLSHYDPLTHLPNRRLLIQRLQQGLDAHRRHGREGAVVVLDLAQLSLLNTTRGHSAGDELLRQAAQRLQACVSHDDLVARLGSDEFAVLLQDLSRAKDESARQVQEAVAAMQQAFVRPFELGGHRHACAVVIGVALYSDSGGDAEDTLKLADLALHQAKREGPSALRFYNQTMQERAEQRALLEAGLREALTREQFFLDYQPQFAADGRILGAEALVRWRHPDGGVRMPGLFIELAESSGLIVPLGRWILRSACAQIAAWQARPESAGWRVAVNVSARQFHDEGFVDDVLQILRSTGAPADRLELELTESQLLQDQDNVTRKMHQLRGHGITFALDDFGTGYASLGYLRHLPLSRLKIDKSFVDRLPHDAHDLAIVRTIHTLATHLGLEVIAEGVETEAQRSCLLSIGDMAIQGYLLGRPKSPERLLARFASGDGAAG
ncbi:EAL domain-containing protein [Leptothrix discophora]|uniref:EAL domain-containing protein n=1 Tax=Leptothrix discophora TaxID=89 RepID=A0ABT9FZP1_LEPDI|nr:EAL domain-containing protein [Leptothrix discophora]MDP4299695.1 EAL domain-containing protein [Leptothrix discophora]